MFRPHYSHAGSCLSICIYSRWLNLMDTSQWTQQAGEKPGIPWVLINCAQWGARSLPPAAPLISNLDEAAGPPGTRWKMTRTILTSAGWAGQSAQLYPRPALSSLSLSPFCGGYPVHSLCQCSHHCSGDAKSRLLFPCNTHGCLPHNTNFLPSTIAAITSLCYGEPFWEKALTVHQRRGLVCFCSDLTLT